MITYTCDYCRKEIFSTTGSNAKYPHNTLSSKVELCGVAGGSPMLDIRVIFDTGNFAVHLCERCRCDLAQGAIEKLHEDLASKGD